MILFASQTFKPLYTFSTEQKRVQRLTNNLQGLQKVMVKEFSWNITLVHEMLYFLRKHKNNINSRTRELWIYFNTCHDTAERAETRVGFHVMFSRLRWPIEPKFSEVYYFICKAKQNNICVSYYTGQKIRVGRDENTFYFVELFYCFKTQGRNQC